MSKLQKKKQKLDLSSALTIIGAAVYVLTLCAFSILLLSDLPNLDVKTSMAILIGVLFIAGLGIGYKIASNTPNRILTVLGTVCLSILFMFPGFFLILLLGWTIAVSHT